MGFNKRYLDKEKIMETIKSKGSIQKLTNVDALICDYWSGRFMEHYDFKNYQKLRDKLCNDTKFSSNHQTTYDHENFPKILNIKNLSNILENLVSNNDSWIEVILTFQLLGNDDVPKSASGLFDQLKKICIDKIINHYTTESRDKIISNILS